MNIFILSRDPEKAAKMMCDKHVVKMVLETAQLLCSPFPKGKAPYKRSHYNHPSSIWARKSSSNYDWLIKHGEALCEEYSFRYGREHKSEEVISWCKKNKHKLIFEESKLTPFAQVVKDKYLHQNPVKAYRDYYRGEKNQIAKWTKRSKPSWWE